MADVEAALITNAAGSATGLKKCDFAGCNYVAYGKCDLRRCGSFGCKRAFCLHHKAKVVRLNKEFMENGICKEC